MEYDIIDDRCFGDGGTFFIEGYRDITGGEHGIIEGDKRL